MTDPTDLGVATTAAAIRSGELTSIDATEACLERIARLEASLQAWAHLDRDGALATARDRDADRRTRRALGPLHGVPIGVKDIIDVAGMPTRHGAPPFAWRDPGLDAELVGRLRAAGAVIVGKTVTTQFAFKDPAPTRNPWAADHTPGGSSSGSAAAVAARMVPAAIGTQTVGSVVRPAAFCGVVGFKGAYGDVPMDGVGPLAPSFDTAGVLTRFVADAALVEAVMAGAASPKPLDADDRPPRLTIDAALFERAEPSSRAALLSTIDGLRAAGATIVASPLPAPIDEVMPAGLIVLEAEAAAVHAAEFAAHSDSYAPMIAELIRAGERHDAATIADARARIVRFRAVTTPFLAEADALLSPVAPGPAPLRGGTGDFILGGPWTFIGVPSISIPVRLDDDGLPLALQLVGSAGGRDALLAAAAWCERVIGFEARPPV